MKISDRTIATVKERADIAEVIGDRVTLKKQGRSLVGLCPFHDDKSPSFSVTPEKGMYYCFSCGAGGDTLKFIQEIDGTSFTDAVLGLARRYQVPVETESPEQREQFQRQRTERDRLYEVCAIAAQYFQYALYQSQGCSALDYLRHQRGLPEETIRQFQLGYAPTGWDDLHTHLVNKGFDSAFQEKAGLVVPRKSGRGHYDRFRDRLMIPIRDIQGRTIAFGGRSLGDATPKYLNSPETPIFDKSKTLFGLDMAKREIKTRDQAIVVEGYFDVIALHRSGFPQAVATLGTAVNGDQIRTLCRFTDSSSVVLAFDADGAGKKATDRAITAVEDQALRGEIQLRVLTLPQGKDADEYLKCHGVDEFGTHLKSAPLWMSWQLGQAIAGRDLSQPDQFQQAVTAIASLLRKIPNPALRTHYIHHCAERLAQGHGARTVQLERDLRSLIKPQSRPAPVAIAPPQVSRQERIEAQILSVLIHKPEFIPQLPQNLVFATPHLQSLWIHLRSPETIPFPQEHGPKFQTLYLLDDLGELAIANARETLQGALRSLEELHRRSLKQRQLDQWLSQSTQQPISV